MVLLIWCCVLGEWRSLDYFGKECREDLIGSDVSRSSWDLSMLIVPDPCWVKDHCRRSVPRSRRICWWRGEESCRSKMICWWRGKRSWQCRSRRICWWWGERSWRCRSRRICWRLLSSCVVDMSIEVKWNMYVPKACHVRRDVYLLAYILLAKDTVHNKSYTSKKNIYLKSRPVKGRRASIYYFLLQRIQLTQHIVYEYQGEYLPHGAPSQREARSLTFFLLGARPFRERRASWYILPSCKS